MPYTNPWSDTDPPGTQAANTIDDELRQLRLDIHERMDSVVVDWTTDPVVPKTVGSDIRAVMYNDASSPGVKAATYLPIPSVLLIAYEGTTAANSTVTINLNEVNTTSGKNWQVSNLYKFASILSPMSFSGKLTGAQITIDVDQMSIDVINNLIILGFRRDDAGTIGNTLINFFATFAFTAVP